MADKVTIAKTTGTASAGGGDLSGSAIQQAMDAAALQCFKKGITDPDKVREHKLAAREKVKRDHAAQQAKAARETARKR